MSYERGRRHRRAGMLALVLALTVAPAAWAQDAAKPPAAEPKPSMTIYGFAMLDIGQNFTQIHPDWFDTMRVSKLPSYDKQYGEDGVAFAGVRQSRLGVKTSSPTRLGELKTQFEFELFGTGVDSGQTTFRLRHAYGELGAFGAGQTWSPFMDPDVFPNSLEYWGPTGMVFFRNVQVRWMPIKGDSNLTLALERPGASGDAGVLADRIELQNIKGRTPLPDFTGAVHLRREVGLRPRRRRAPQDQLGRHARRPVRPERQRHGLGPQLQLQPQADVEGRHPAAAGLRRGHRELHERRAGGHRHRRNPGNTVSPIKGVAIPILGLVAFLDHGWNDRWSSTVGYSLTDQDNTEGQTPDAYRRGHYALFNLLYTPVPNVMMGGEFQWGRRENFSDGFTSDGVKIQFSFKYNFSHTLGGQ